MEDKMTVLCVSNSYEQKYYLNPEFMGLPKTIKDDLQIISVLFTEDVGGILTWGFEPDGTLTLNVTCDEGDLLDRAKCKKDVLVKYKDELKNDEFRKAFHDHKCD